MADIGCAAARLLSLRRKQIREEVARHKPLILAFPSHPRFWEKCSGSYSYTFSKSRLSEVHHLMPFAICYANANSMVCR